MDQPLTWAALVGSVGSIIALIGFWLRIGTRLGVVETKSDSASVVANAVNAKIDFRDQQTEEVRAKIRERVAVLESTMNATSQSLLAVESRLVKTMEDLSSEVGQLREAIIGNSRARRK
jgi:hypothetical protein